MSYTAYPDTEDVQSYLGMSQVNNAVALDAALRGAVSSIERRCRRSFLPSADATAREFEVIGRTLFVDDFWSTDGLVIKTDPDNDGTFANVVDADTYRAPTASDTGTGWPYTSLKMRQGFWPCGLVQVTAKWGWAGVPDDVWDATLLLAARLYKRKDSVDGTAGWGEMGAIRIGRTDPDVDALLSPYVKVIV